MVAVNISWNIPPKYATIAKTRFGEVIGITLYSPSPVRKPDVKYPYIAYSYKRIHALNGLEAYVPIT